MELSKLLDLQMNNSCYSEGFTLRHFFLELLSTLWQEDERFSGKRPFGNSGWRYDVYAVLIRNGLIAGSLDSDNFVKEVDTVEADLFVTNNILLPLFNNTFDPGITEMPT